MKKGIILILIISNYSAQIFAQDLPDLSKNHWVYYEQEEIDKIIRTATILSYDNDKDVEFCLLMVRSVRGLKADPKGTPLAEIILMWKGGMSLSKRPTVKYRMVGKSDIINIDVVHFKSNKIYLDPLYGGFLIVEMQKMDEVKFQVDVDNRLMDFDFKLKGSNDALYKAVFDNKSPYGFEEKNEENIEFEEIELETEDGLKH